MSDGCVNGLLVRYLFVSYFNVKFWVTKVFYSYGHVIKKWLHDPLKLGFLFKMVVPLSASYCRLWTEFNSSSICVFLYRQTFLSTDRTKIVKCFWCLTICSYDRRYFEAKWGWFCQNFEWVLEDLFCNVAKTILIVDFPTLIWREFNSLLSDLI